MKCINVGCVSRGPGVYTTHDTRNCKFPGRPALDRQGFGQREDPRSRVSGAKSKQPFSYQRNNNSQGSSSQGGKGLNRNHKPSSFGRKAPKGKGKGKGGNSHPFRPSPDQLLGMKQRLRQSTHFMEEIKEQFYTTELTACADRIIECWDIANICQGCFKLPCNGYCEPGADPIDDHIPEAKEIFRQNPNLGRAIRAALHGGEEDDPYRCEMASVNTETFYTHHMWAEDYSDGDQDPGQSLFGDLHRDQEPDPDDSHFYEGGQYKESSTGGSLFAQDHQSGYALKNDIDPLTDQPQSLEDGDDEEEPNVQPDQDDDQEDSAGSDS